MLKKFKTKTEICNYVNALLLFLIISIVFCSCSSARKINFLNKLPDLGIQIKEQRKQKGYSIKELAAAVKMSEQSLRLIEKGQATPIYPKLISIQEFLNAEFVLTY